MVTRKPLNDLLGQKVDYTCVPKPEVISWNVGILELWNGGSKKRMLSIVFCINLKNFRNPLPIILTNQIVEKSLNNKRNKGEKCGSKSPSK